MYIKSDFLILGSGIAGLTLAIKLADLGTVAVVTKKETLESSTNYAQGGIAAVVDPFDSYEEHAQDTIMCGAGLCNEDVVRFTVSEGPERIKELISWGVQFSRSENDSGGFDLGREGGHSSRRVLHAKDLTGHEIEKTLIKKAGELTNIHIYENFTAVDLILQSMVSKRQKDLKTADRCVGAYILDPGSGEVHIFQAKFTIFATGGAGKVYLVTTNPHIATGDGIAMAYRAGAQISNLEFMQFHPTCLFRPDASSFLISEAVRGEGGILKLRNGKTFMEKYHPMNSLAPRDIVARAIDNELKKAGDNHVLLDISHQDSGFVRNRFPTIYKKCMDIGIDITLEPIPVVPAAHYMCGGVLVDHNGKTNVDRLFASGEVACTGLHGANRLASNSLLESLVFSHRTAMHIRDLLPRVIDEQFDISPWDCRGAIHSDESIVVTHNWDEIRRCMWNYVGIVRSDKRLERARRRIDLIQQEIDEYYRNFIITRDLVELRNIVTVANLIIQCASMRKESRGIHYNIDYPEADNSFIKNTVVDKYIRYQP